MPMFRKLVAAALVAVLALGGVACSDDKGEDRVGDGEVNDEGD